MSRVGDEAVGPRTEKAVAGARSFDAPDALWVFDGVCHFCSTSVRIVMALDRAGAIRFVPVQSAYGRRLASDAGVDPDSPRSFLFFDRGVPLQRSAGALALLRRLPRPWRWLSVLRWVPEAWRDAAYDCLAANRYRWFGRRRVCIAPTPEQRSRFLLEPPER